MSGQVPRAVERAAREGGPRARAGGAIGEGRQDRADRRALRDRSKTVRQVSVNEKKVLDVCVVRCVMTRV